MKTKTILLTFDYELFLKKSGTVENCLIKPVDSYLSITADTDITGTFFVDTLFLCRIRDRHFDQYQRIRTQLINLVRAGNRIELHLHPSWLDAVNVGTKENPQWLFNDFKRYSLVALEETTIDKMFREGIEVLEQIGREVDSDYQVCAYRAGGWSIDPFSKIRACMIKHGILCDSTVCAGLYRSSHFQNYDFRHAPDAEYWNFNKEPAIVQEGPFIEIPITTYKYSPWNKVFRKFRMKIEKTIHPNRCRYFGDGEGISLNDMQPEKSQNFFKRLTQPNMYTLQDVFPGYNRQLLKKEKRNIINFISHPKKMNLNSFREIAVLQRDGHDFITLKDLLERILQDVQNTSGNGDEN